MKDLDLERRCLATLQRVSRAEFLTPATILRSFSKASGISQEHILGKRKTYDLALVRHFFFFALYSCLQISQNRISTLYHKDHTSIMYACRRIEPLFEDYRDENHNETFPILSGSSVYVAVPARLQYQVEDIMDFVAEQGRIPFCPLISFPLERYGHTYCDKRVIKKNLRCLIGS